jgi:hypothetical protein
MKKGDLYYLMHIPETKALVTKTFKERQFTNCPASFHGFPSIQITPYVEVVIVAGKHKGEKEKYTQEKFNRCFRKIEV